MNTYKQKEVIGLSYGEMWDRISCYGLLALLVLYLNKYFLYTDQASYSIYGAYTALSFAFTIVGGLIADKMLGSYRAAFWGGILISISNFLLLIPEKNLFFLGLAIMVVGIGLFKPNNLSLVGSIHPEQSAERDKSFSTFYFCINLGGILGPIIYGIFAEYRSYSLGFLLSMIGMLSSVIMLNQFKNRFKKTNKMGTTSFYPLSISSGSVFKSATFFIVISVLSAWFLLTYIKWFVGFLVAGCGMGIVFLVVFIRKLSSLERNKLLVLIAPFSCCIAFLACLLQSNSSLIVFFDRYVNRDIYHWRIPAAWFASIEPIFILLAVPLVAKVWRYFKIKNAEPESKNKLIIGLILSAMSFFIFSLCVKVNYNNQILVFCLILLGNFILAVSELCIIPVTMSMTNLVSPPRYKSTMIGIFYCSLTLSGYFAGVIAKFVTSAHQSTPYISSSLFEIGLGLFLFSFVIAFLSWVIPFANTQLMVKSYD